MESSVLIQLPDSHLFRHRSTIFLQLSYRKRSAPNRGERLLQAAKAQNSDAARFRSPPMPSVPLQRDYPQSAPASRTKKEPRLTLAYHADPLPVTALSPWSNGRR